MDGARDGVKGNGLKREGEGKKGEGEKGDGEGDGEDGDWGKVLGTVLPTFLNGRVLRSYQVQGLQVRDANAALALKEWCSSHELNSVFLHFKHLFFLSNSAVDGEQLLPGQVVHPGRRDGECLLFTMTRDVLCCRCAVS